MTRLVIAMAVALACGFAAGAQESTKKAYILAQINVTNAQQYGEYTKLSPAIIEKFGGRFVARGGRNVTLEGTPASGRIVLLEFPSFEKAQEFYNSADYQAAKKVRAGAATVQFVLVEGLQ